MSVLVVSGTSTGVGKTVTTAAIAALAQAAGQRVAVLKPAQAGYDDTDPGDVPAVRAMLGDDCEVTTREIRRFPEPLSPDVAARRSGMEPVSIAEMVEVIEELEAEHDLVLVEGAGGLLVKFDQSGATIADVAATIGAPVLIVAGAALGTRNHTALTAQALSARGVNVFGVVIGSWPSAAGLAEYCNVGDLAIDADAPLLGAVAEGAGNYRGRQFLDTAAQSLAPSLHGRFDTEAFMAWAKSESENFGKSECANA